MQYRGKRGNVQADAGFCFNVQRGHRFMQECLWSHARRVNQGSKTEHFIQRGWGGKAQRTLASGSVFDLLGTCTTLQHWKAVGARVQKALMCRRTQSKGFGRSGWHPGVLCHSTGYEAMNKCAGLNEFFWIYKGGKKRKLSKGAELMSEQLG